MESHVSGGITPLSIGELRQSILAVLIGNPLFTEEEQLLANHLTHECEDADRLVRWLRNVRLQDAKRGTLTRTLNVLDSEIQSVCLDKAAQMAESDALLSCRALGKCQKRLLESLMTGSGRRASTRLQLLGYGYVALLENMGRIPEHIGFEIIRKN